MLSVVFLSLFPTFLKIVSDQFIRFLRLHPNTVNDIASFLCTPSFAVFVASPTFSGNHVAATAAVSTFPAFITKLPFQAAAGTYFTRVAVALPTRIITLPTRAVTFNVTARVSDGAMTSSYSLALIARVIGIRTVRRQISGFALARSFLNATKDSANLLIGFSSSLGGCPR